jgi:hypothetical protein
MILLLAALALAGCNGGHPQASAPEAMVMDQATYEAWEIALVEMRIEKNERFADEANTPLPAERLASFDGLNYYFPRADLRFRTPFMASAGTDTVLLTKRRGQIVPYLRRGQVRFSHEGRVHTLPVFGPAAPAEGNYLWLPFTDPTTGQDTYAGGRYLDITLDADGMIDLDFNRAYNPLCDYNADKFNCTLPPAESRLDFAVEAGEKTFGTGH